MQITRIFHSGFLVETAKRYFIFDYYKGELPKLNPDKPVYVFASHGHQDHYEPKVFELLKQQGIVPKLAILAKDIKEKKYPGSLTLCFSIDFHNPLQHSPLRLIFLSIFSFFSVLFCTLVV